MVRLSIGLAFVALNIFCAVSVNGQAKEKEEFICPVSVGNNNNFADPATCRRFYQCVDGFPYLNRCPSGLYFDDVNKFCTFKDEAKCGPLPTRYLIPIAHYTDKKNIATRVSLQFTDCISPATITDAPVDLAERCDPDQCELPYCFCSKDGTSIPGDLELDKIPQMILLTFDGAVNLNNYEHYRKIFNKKRKNPNGCDIRGTFFISHEYSNYQQIQTLAYEGHEIATETISMQTGLQDKGYEEWVGEMIGMREILRHFANVTTADVVGMRAPFLKPGRNTQYKVIEDFGYIYDSSVTVPPVNVPIWPYTLDFKISHECKSGTCPSKIFPGVWEVPLNTHYIEGYEGGHCPYMDQCVLHNLDVDEVVEWLQEDFSRYYEQNKAPYMLPFHTNWFQSKDLELGLHKFLDWTLTLPDVYIVTVTQALTWITDPKEIRELNSIDSWDCQKRVPTASKPCLTSNYCGLAFTNPEKNISDTRYMETCRECPNKYPWLGDAEGTGIVGRDNYVYTGTSQGDAQPERRRK